MNIEFEKDDQRLLFKEASLSAMNLGVGLTFLFRYNFSELGFIYQAFFSLSIGLERILKLILVYEYYALYGKFPSDNKYLKSKGYNILELYNEVEKLAVKYKALHHFEVINQNPICINILNNLSDFAISSRYFHLDRLSNSSQKSSDPLKTWDCEVNDLINQKHDKGRSKQETEIITGATYLDDKSLIRSQNEKDIQINSYSALIEEGLKSMIKQKYSMFYSYTIVRALCTVQEIQNRTHHSNASVV